jgi:hypothetical protein
MDANVAEIKAMAPAARSFADSLIRKLRANSRCHRQRSDPRTTL